MAIFVDTNVLLKGIFLDHMILSTVTLEELENIKTNKIKSDEVRFQARRAERWLIAHDGEYSVVPYGIHERDIIENYGLEYTPDNKICACAASQPCEFLTYDLSCRNIAEKIFGLRLSSYLDDENKNIYTGYKIIAGTTDEINEQMNDLSFAVNEYVIIQNVDDASQKEMRFDGEKFVSLKLPPSRIIKAKNALQRCALDLLANPDITVAAILGGYGSGKTFLSMRMALYGVRDKGFQSKILGVREPVGEGHEIGFLPGEFENKTDLFFAPLVQQLEGGEFELERLKQQGMLESNIPVFLKGTTYNNTIIVVDEAEDLTKKQVRLIGTRIGENSRIFLAGDYKQSVINASDSNALIDMCNAFKGNHKFGCVYLGEDVRSSTSKMFAELFND